MKGQAAIEYLMTYGWALLVIAVVLVVLISSGVLDPSSNIKESCVFPPQVSCVMQYAAVKSNNVEYKVRLANNFGYDVELISFKAVYGKSVASVSNIGMWKQGEEKDITVTFTNADEFPIGRAVSLRLELEYKPCPLELGGCSSNTYVIKGNSFVRINRQ